MRGIEQIIQDLLLHYHSLGLPRTGTASTYTALERLLPGRCHHMFRAKTGKNDPAFWTQAARGELGDEEWKEFIRLGMFMLNDEHIVLVSQN